MSSLTGCNLMDLKIDSIAYHISFLIISNNLIRKYKNIWKYLKIHLSDIHGASRIIGSEGRRKEGRWKGGKTMKTMPAKPVAATTVGYRTVTKNIICKFRYRLYPRSRCLRSNINRQPLAEIISSFFTSRKHNTQKGSPCLMNTNEN